MSKFKGNIFKNSKNKKTENSDNEEDIFVFLEDNNESNYEYIHKNTEKNDDIIIIKRKLSKKVKAAIIIPSVIIGLLAVVFITIMLMASSGKKAFTKKQTVKHRIFQSMKQKVKAGYLLTRITGIITQIHLMMVMNMSAIKAINTAIILTY